jgi:hypothetical protein
VAGQDRRGARGIVQGERVLARVELVRVLEPPEPEAEDF